MLFVEGYRDELWLEKSDAMGNQVAFGGLPAQMQADGTPPPQGSARIVLSLNDALEASRGEGMFKQRALDHGTASVKCMQKMNSMFKEGSESGMNMQYYDLMKKLQGMHAGLSDQFANLVLNPKSNGNPDGLMAASEYAKKAQEVLEQSLSQMEQQAQQGQQAQKSDPVLYVQSQPSGSPGHILN